MSTFALIFNGAVVQLSSQRFDVAAPLAWQDVTAASPAPAVGWSAVNTSGVWSFSAPVAPPAPVLTLAQQAAAQLLAGCQIVSTSSPGVSGTYAVDSDTTNRAASISIYIQVNGRFPAGLPALAWPDAAGVMHVFTSTATFQAAASAWADFVTHIELVINGVMSQLPAQPSTIP